MDIVQVTTTQVAGTPRDHILPEPYLGPTKFKVDNFWLSAYENPWETPDTYLGQHIFTDDIFFDSDNPTCIMYWEPVWVKPGASYKVRCYMEAKSLTNIPLWAGQIDVQVSSRSVEKLGDSVGFFFYDVPNEDNFGDAAVANGIMPMTWIHPFTDEPEGGYDDNPSYNTILIDGITWGVPPLNNGYVYFDGTVQQGPPFDEQSILDAPPVWDREGSEIIIWGDPSWAYNPVITHPIGSKNRCSWSCGNIKVTQDIVIENRTTVSYTWTLENRDSVSHEIGFRRLFRPWVDRDWRNFFSFAPSNVDGQGYFNDYSDIGRIVDPYAENIDKFMFSTSTWEEYFQYYDPNYAPYIRAYVPDYLTFYAEVTWEKYGELLLPRAEGTIAVNDMTLVTQDNKVGVDTSIVGSTGSSRTSPTTFG